MIPFRPFIRDESGSITIVTLFVVLSLLMSLASFTQIYLTEKQFTELERIQLQHHTLHQMTYQLVFNQVNQQATLSLSGQFTFPNGSSTYMLTTMNDLTLLYIDSRTPDAFTVRHYYTIPEAAFLFNEP